MRLKLSLTILIPLALASQPSPKGVIFATPFTAIATVQASQPVSNIGQSLHVLVIDFPTAVADVTPVQVRLEGSFDNVIYLPIMEDVITVPLLGGRVYSMVKCNGVYPYVRVNSLVVTPGALPMTVHYVGHVYSVLPVVRQGVDRYVL